MILLAAIRDGHLSTCGPECWGARLPVCRCVCAGLAHGCGPEEAARRIASLDLASLAGYVAMPELPLWAARTAVVVVEPVRRRAVRMLRAEVRCVGCVARGLPGTGATLAALLDDGWYCDDCLAALWRSA